MTKKQKIIAAIIIILLLILTVYFLFPKKKDNIIKTFGNIEIRQVDLSFQVAGIIDEVYVEEGDYVKKGDLLAKLIDKDYKANYKKALFEKETSLAQLNEDSSKYHRNLPLCKDGTISAQECTTLKNTKDLSYAKFNQNNANVEYEKNQLDYTKLYAPNDGIITTRAQEKGARVNANQIVYVMSLHKPIWIRAYIKETDLLNIKYKMKAKVLTDTIDTATKKPKEYTGYIGYISPVAEFTPKTVQTEDLRADLVYRIRVYIDEVDEFLRQGMPVTVEIDLNQNKEK